MNMTLNVMLLWIISRSVIFSMITMALSLIVAEVGF